MEQFSSNLENAAMAGADVAALIPARKEYYYLGSGISMFVCIIVNSRLKTIGYDYTSPKD